MKLELVLLFCDALTRDGSILRDDFCEEHKICERAFYITLSSLNKFLIAYKPQCKIKKDRFGAYFLGNY